MTTFYSDLRTNDRATPPVKNRINRLGGRQRSVVARYTVPASGIAANDLVELFTLKKGEAIMQGSKAFWSDGAASQTIDVGDATTENKYLAAADVSTGSGSSLMEAHLAAGADIAIASEDTVIYLKFEAATPQAGQVLTFFFNITSND